MTVTAPRGRRSPITPLTASVVFWVLVVVVVIAQVVVVVPAFTVMRLWEDEAFNLTVPINLINGLGYTSDGTLSGSLLAPFDPRISTGPVVLLPIAAVLALGADPVIGGRAVMVLFYLGLLAGLWLLGRRIGGRWAGLAAVTVPLGLNTVASVSPIQTPVDILGEVPTAAFIVWALLVMQKRPWLAGLFVGLALESKTIALLAVPAVAVGVFFTLASQPFWSRVRRVLVCGAFAVVPVAAVELWKLVSLGPVGYVTVTKQFAGFLLSGGQGDNRVPVTDKLSGLLSSWFSPTILSVLLVAIVVVVAVVVVVLARRDALPALPTEATGRELVVLLAATLVGLVTWTAWWSVSSHLPVWIRHPSPGLFAFVPVLAAFLVLGARLLWRARSSGAPARRTGLRVVAVAASVLLVGTLAVQVWGHTTTASEVRFGETLADQRAAASAIADLGEGQLASNWGPEVSVVVLSGAQAALVDAPGFAETTRVLANFDTSEDGIAFFDAVLESDCAEVPVRVGHYAVCVPR
ncbi:MAG: glycosyltransferase family 39 protein [Mycetocola sp.]